MLIPRTIRGTQRNDALRRRFTATVAVTAQRQMSPPTRARSCAKVRLRVSCFLAGSFPGARFGKYLQKFREVLHRQMHGQQLRTLAFRAFVPAAPRRPGFSLRASADPDSPRL